MTPQGEQAQQILLWAYEDPAGRAAEGVRRVNELARSAEGQALREIQDSGTMLARLVSGQPARNISSQMEVP